MKIDILAVGKIKERFFTDAADEYLKRLSRYAKVSIFEVKDEKTAEGASAHENDLVKAAEAEAAAAEEEARAEEAQAAVSSALLPAGQRS